jgi:Holliday junction resolvase RusA-like endonuclease
VTTLVSPAVGHHPELVFDLIVFGTAATQGSKVAGVAASGARFVREDNPDLKRWRTQVAEAVGKQHAGQLILGGPVGLDLIFYRPRGKTHYTSKGALTAAAKRTPYPTMAPDCGKLARAVEDAMAKVVYLNDAQIVDVRVRKAWGMSACVRIRLYKLAS